MFVMAWTMPMGISHTIGSSKQTTNAHTGKPVSQPATMPKEMATMPTKSAAPMIIVSTHLQLRDGGKQVVMPGGRKGERDIPAYHQSSASRYFFISRM